MIITGHRGSLGTEPENTLRSFRRAVADGCDEIELDLRVSADGELVIIHDATVDRTTTGSGEVAFLTLVTNSTAFWIGLIAGFVAYLVGATAYGFAGQRQGVKVGARTALVVLLLLAVIPILDVVGLLGILITAIVRRGTTSATPV